MHSGNIGKTSRKLLSKLFMFSIGFLSLSVSDCSSVYPTTMSYGDILRKEEVFNPKISSNFCGLCFSIYLNFCDEFQRL